MDILNRISNCIIEMNEDEIESLIIKAVKEMGISIQDIYEKGLNKGMIEALSRYEKKVYDIPEVIVCADILNKGLLVLKKQGNFISDNKGKIVLSVVKGDTHEIGKNIVKIMFKAAGYEVFDLGVNRSIEEIIDEALEKKVEIIGLSSMMTTTRGEMKKLIAKLNDMGILNRPKVIVGGGSITKAYADSIGADGYATNAPLAVELVGRLLKEMN